MEMGLIVDSKVLCLSKVSYDAPQRGLLLTSHFNSRAVYYCTMRVLFFSSLVLISSAFTSKVFTRGTQSSPVYMSLEKTYIMIKPDGVQRRVIGDIIQRFEAKGYQVAISKIKLIIIN